LRAAYPDRIVVIGAKDVPQGESWVEQGKADLVFDWNTPVSIVNRYDASATLRNRVFTDPLDSVSTLTLNLAVPPLDDLHVRRAINDAVARSALVPIFTRYLTTANVASHLAPDALENDLLLNYAPYGNGDPNLDAARAELARSRYGNSSGSCIASACRSLSLTVPSDSIERVKMGEEIVRDLAPLGIRVQLDRVPDTQYFAALTDPSARPDMVLIAYSKDFPSGSDYFPSTFSSSALVSGNGDPSLLGATPRQLHQWGYSVDSVPNVDDRISQCQRATFSLAVSCWASLDQYLMQAVVPWVPLLAWTGSFVVSSRVRSFSFDQSVPFPAASLDRIRLATGPPAAPP
jgi:ABC-type transport system substrate-binding protein